MSDCEIGEMGSAIPRSVRTSIVNRSIAERSSWLAPAGNAMAVRSESRNQPEPGLTITGRGTIVGSTSGVRVAGPARAHALAKSRMHNNSGFDCMRYSSPREGWSQALPSVTLHSNDDRDLSDRNGDKHERWGIEITGE